MSATGITDRMRVEVALPARMLFRCVEAIGDATKEAGESPEHLEPLLRDLKDACHEAVAGLTADRSRTLARRINREHAAALEAFAERPTMLACLVVLYWYKQALDEEILVLTPGSPLDRATAALLEILERHGEDWDDLDRSARKNARRMMERFRASGLFLPVRQAGRAA